MNSTRPDVTRPGLVGRRANPSAVLALVLSLSSAGAEPTGGVGKLLSLSGVDRGLCAVLAPKSAETAAQLAHETRFLITVVQPDRTLAEAQRASLDERGLYGRRVTVDWTSLVPLPYASDLLDALVYTLPEAGPAASANEVVRVLRPAAVAVVQAGGNTGAARLRRWSESVPGAKTSLRREGKRVWLELRKTVPAGFDEWTHWQHGPDNNPVSRDRVIRPPYRTKYLALPWFTSVPSISVVAGGRLFRVAGPLATHGREREAQNTLFATSAFNGTLLWSRPVPPGFLASPSLFVATPDTLFLALGDRCLKLDASTGRERGEVSTAVGASSRGVWKWLAVTGGTLYGLLSEPGKRPGLSDSSRWRRGPGRVADQRGAAQNTGGGRLLAAIDLRTNRVLWKHAFAHPVEPRSVCMNSRRLFVHCERAAVVCLDRKTGKVQWTNTNKALLSAIAVPFGPAAAFPLSPYALCSEQAVYFGGQGRRAVVALSAATGKPLWTVTGAFNATNLLLLDGNLVGHVPSCVFLDGGTGKAVRDPGLAKQSCARLTSCGGALFYRGSFPADKAGEGMVRYDVTRATMTVLHAFRPPCNDGVLPAEGQLHLTPWDCETNMQLVGEVSLCSAQDADAPSAAASHPPAEVVVSNMAAGTPLVATKADWATYRHDNRRSSATVVTIPRQCKELWRRRLSDHALSTGSLSPPTAAGPLVFLARDTGVVVALETASGRERWRFRTAAAVRLPPAVWRGRAYFGCADGNVFALEAATGRLLWRRRLAPSRRKIMVYGQLSSTWPVNSGVLVRADGPDQATVYAAAGLLNYDGTYVCALDAVTGRLKWMNAASGTLNHGLGLGVSVQGNLALAGNRLWLAGGNNVSPAGYELTTGRCVNRPPGETGPTGNRGSDVLGFLGKYVMTGGPRLFTQDDDKLVDWTAPYQVFQPDVPGRASAARFKGLIPPAAGNGVIAVAGKGPVVCLSQQAEDDWMGSPQTPARRLRWVARSLRNCRALAVTRNCVLAAGRPATGNDHGWVLQALDLQSGTPRWTQELSDRPVRNGLLVTRDGRVVAVLENDWVVCFGKG